jgi:hypothetical protein
MCADSSPWHRAMDPHRATPRGPHPRDVDEGQPRPRRVDGARSELSIALLPGGQRPSPSGGDSRHWRCAWPAPSAPVIQIRLATGSRCRGRAGGGGAGRRVPRHRRGAPHRQEPLRGGRRRATRGPHANYMPRTARSLLAVKARSGVRAEPVQRMRSRTSILRLETRCAKSSSRLSTRASACCCQRSMLWISAIST